MIKKHLIVCSVMLVMMVTAKMFIYSTPVEHFEAPVKSSTVAENDEPAGQSSVNSLSFANEDLPLGDPKVEYRMKRALRAHKFANLQTTALHQKAARWFPVIEPILKLYGIPQDFKYIPLVESGLSSGTSSKGASGYWQFMPGTARNFGLRVNSRIDERQNMHKSTVAACKYLRSMFAELKSWTLVAAAYNLGDVKLKQQMNRQNQDNYFKMKLNRETGAYVYKLISMKEIIEKPVKYGYGQSPALLARADGPKKIFIDPVTEHNALRALQILKN